MDNCIEMTKKSTCLLHAAGWILLFCTPLMYFDHGNGITLRRFIVFSMTPVTLMAAFYTNYLWLVPQYYTQGKMKWFCLINVLLILSLGIWQHYWMVMGRTYIDIHPIKPRHGANEPPDYMFIVFILRNVFNLTLAVVVSMALYLVQTWHKTEDARRAAEQAKTEAELKNLRSQINPHFLLNTLNNIYALTVFDTGRAQKAIEQLSRLLRHVLYDNQCDYVDIHKESDFLQDYVNLMRIRLSKNVEVRFNSEIADTCHTQIAPMIFISLLENAFKHGVSPTEPSHIDIRLAADDHTTECSIVNSNYPKKSTDRSGHGIGLQQVGIRLEITYHGRYSWEHGPTSDGKEYRSRIIIYNN